jgi:regulator of sigma E protease
MTVLNFAFAFVLLLGVLITVHEFGHFIVAKLCGVRVLKFSIGFGNPIGFGRWRARWERGGTEYVLAWLPLGGFVKMLGEQPGEEESPEALADPRHALNNKPVWQKLAVVLAGPAMNLLLPVMVFTGQLAYGVDRPEAVVGAIEAGSPAARAGLRPGDRVAAVDGATVRWWDELEREIRERPGETLALSVLRGEAPLDVTLAVAERKGLDVFQQASRVGWLGLQHRRQDAKLGIPRADAPAAAVGLRSGDRVVAVGGTPVADWEAFAAAYAAAGTRGRVVVEVARSETQGERETPAEGEPAQPTVRVEVPALGGLDALGVVPATVLVSDVTPDSAAAAAGLEPGDLILAVDGQPVGSFAWFAETVRASEGRMLRIAYARAGRTHEAEVTPRLTENETPAGRERAFLVGIRAEDATLPGVFSTDRELNPLVSLPRAVARTWEVTVLTVQAVSKIVLGDISRSQIGGPIEIARQAHSAMQAGWEVYLNLMVLISVNLAILNLIPIPVLDGGQALLFTIEGVRRKPLSLRAREIAMQIGVTMVVLLMGFAFWNDVSRYWSRVVDWVKQGAGL